MSEEAHKIITDKLNEILKILNGNGKLGVCAKVNILWSVGLFVVVTVSGLFIRAIMMG